MDRESAQHQGLGLRIHPRLVDLQTTRELIEVYKSLIKELPVISWKDLPPGIIGGISKLILRKAADPRLMSALKRKNVLIYDYVNKCRKIVWLE